MQDYKHNTVSVHIDQRRMLDIMQLARGMGETGRVETGQMVAVLTSFLNGAVAASYGEDSITHKDKQETESCYNCR